MKNLISNRNIKEMPLTRQLPNYMTVARYAKQKEVQEPAIYRRIENGEIVPELIGYDKLVMIDWEKYKDVQFRQFPHGKYPRKPKEYKDLAKD